MLFATQLEFWWAVNALPDIKATFTFPEFLLLVLLALSLFVSAALLRPSRNEDEQSGLRVYFEQDGRYALLPLSSYFLLGLIVNMTFFHASPVGLWGILDLLMTVLPVCAFKAKSRHSYTLITLAFVPLSAIDTAISLAS